MRLPEREHTSRPWRIHELAPDFRLLDVWALPTPGGPDDFPRLVDGVATGDPAQAPSVATRVLWAIREVLGRVLRLDEPAIGVGGRLDSLRDRLPADLRDAPPGPAFATTPFTPIYMLDDEYAAELANKTVHGVIHLGWVQDGAGGYRGQMAVLVKPNGLIGEAYLAAIGPFRHRFVYPSLMKQIGRGWRERDAAS